LPSEKANVAFAISQLADPAAWPAAEAVYASAPPGALDRIKAQVKDRHQGLLKALVDLGQTQGVLAASTATIDGKGARLSAEGDLITNWRGIDSRVHWQATIPEAGEYRVLVQQADGSEEAGTYDLTAGGTTIEAKAKNTGSKATFASVPIGTFKFSKPGTYHFVLRPKSIGGELFDFRSIKLEKQ